RRSSGKLESGAGLSGLWHHPGLVRNRRERSGRVPEGVEASVLTQDQSSLRNSTLPQFSQVKTIRSVVRISSLPGTKHGLRYSFSATCPSPTPVLMFARKVMAPPG